jgi:DNA-3-methyladenine glycosylase
MRINNSFYYQSAEIAAPALVGKILCVRRSAGKILRMRITETECYLGTGDTACHASKGKTPRTSALWQEGGFTYVYLCYGMYYMFNIITGEEDDPQGVLIRGVEGYQGPGKLTKYCGIDKSFNLIDMKESDLIWLEDDGYLPDIVPGERIGIGYADLADQKRLWRFTDRRAL